MSLPPPLVSVIIPVYNGEATVSRAIQSVLDQTWKNIQCIVVDDGSTDGTAAVIQKLGERVSYVRQDNQGVSAARNRGISAATGDFLAFLDSDDCWLDTKIENQVKVFQKHPKIALAYTRFRSEAENAERTIFDASGPSHDEGAVEIFESFNEVFLNPFLATSSVMVKSSAIAEIGAFDTTLITAEDVDFYFRLCWNHPYARLNQKLVLKTRTEGSLGSRLRSYPDLLVVFDKHLKAHPEFFENNKPLVISRILDIYKLWIKELLYRGLGSEARNVLVKSRSVGKMPGFFPLFAKSCICKLIAVLMGRAQKTEVSYQ